VLTLRAEAAALVGAPIDGSKEAQAI